MKKYFTELTNEELEKVLKRNKKLQDYIYNDLKEMDYEFSKEQYDMFLERVRTRYTYHDNYNSYFLRLNDLEGYYFLSEMNLEDLRDYSIVEDNVIEDIKKYIRLYEKADGVCSEKYIDDLQDKLDELAKQVLSGIERYLHEIEDADYTFKDLLDRLIDTTDCYFNDFYIETDNSGEVQYNAYQDFTKCYV